MADPSYRDTALQYRVDDLPGASIPGAQLQKILDKLRLGMPLSPISLWFLERQRLDSLHRLATGALAYDSFRDIALAEQVARIEATSAANLVRDAEKRASEAALQARAKVARVARETDPKRIANIENQELRARFGVRGYVEPHCFRPLMGILKNLDANHRLTEAEFKWLSTTGGEYFSQQMREAYHRIEAEFFANEFEKKCDPWMAVNASHHYRKCDQAETAESMVGSIDVEQQASRKLQSALCTTRGGALRDLKRWEEAIGLGEKAHELQPDDYRPCTLLGAVHMETGNYNRGREWYAKAVERGATESSVDKDLRRIYYRFDKAEQVKMGEFLLSADPVRYKWAESRP